MRIVSLVPEATQWLAAFGTESDVVAQSEDGILNHVPVVETPEYIRAMQPDLLITRTPIMALSAIEQVVYDPRTLKNILESALLLAHKSGGFKKGMEILAEGEKRLMELKTRLQWLSPVPSVVLIRTEPLVAGGRWFPDMLDLAGGDPQFSIGGMSDKELLPEQLEEVVRIVCDSKGLISSELSPPYWILDSTRFGKPDPSVFDTVELLAYALHGTASGITPTEADIRFVGGSGDV